MDEEIALNSDAVIRALPKLASKIDPFLHCSTSISELVILFFAEDDITRDKFVISAKVERYRITIP